MRYMQRIVARLGEITTGQATTHKENNDIVTVTEIHMKTCDGLDGCVNNNNWTRCNKLGEQ